MAGKTWAEISDELKTTPRTIWELRQQYDLDKVLTQLVADQLEATATGYGALVRKAAQRLGEMLDSSDDELRMWAIDRVWPKGAAPALPAAANAPQRTATATAGRSGGAGELPRDRTGVVERAGAAAKRLRSG